ESGRSKELAGRGISVVGFNSLKYFWHRRSPEEAARDLSEVIERYAQRWGRGRVLLIGYSYGADVLPFVASRLPPEIAERVALTVFLNPGHNADLAFHFS